MFGCRDIRKVYLKINFRFIHILGFYTVIDGGPFIETVNTARKTPLGEGEMRSCGHVEMCRHIGLAFMREV